MSLSTVSSASWASHFKATFALGAPLVGSHLAQMLTNTTDVIMLGWYSVEALAAGVLATSAFFVVFIVGSGFALAVMPMVANALGADDETSVRRSVRMGFWLSLIYCAFIMVPLWFLETLLLALGQDPEVSALAQDYMRIAQWSMIPALMIMVFKSYLSALELAGVVLWASLAGAIANIFVNYAFIFGNWGAPELGVRGAAVATLVTTSLSFLFLLVYAIRHPVLKRFTLFQRIWRPDWQAFGDVFQLGWPIGLTLLAETSLFAAASLMLGWIGVQELAAHGIVLQIASISFMIPLGLSNVATIRAGRALGRGDGLGLRRASLVVTVVALFISLCSVAVFLSWPEALIRLFLDDASPQATQIVTYGVVLLATAAAFQVVDTLQVIALGLLRGVRDTAFPMVLAVVSYWGVGVPVAYILGFQFGYGGVGVWSGLVIGLTFAAITMSVRYVLRLKTVTSGRILPS